MTAACITSASAYPRRTHILLLIQDRHIRVINEHTGELLHELTLDYQPLGRRPGPHKQKPRTQWGFGAIPTS